ncbi:MAG: hypothetical protein A3B47_03825 [Candidatus Levybacteria bacterium RIFCSPLOWO2_01_FULL_39_24]|nr:MAG: hypothetical protein A2800_03630 [Candidatus Levybacteria bacterium RIFCSPHIGHO2_01_FULL_40_16]OGH28176.1 MAG: hypothetical protein A3E12_04335 [Candidatus Levybacteria bacterium RIFCSPHIGHO2_12_FULL_39_9]OGH46364.1 MAG: hypothetical protein A3B47_03825 [Candidatus Levybacteria bacterium RIFCSPLOWO2_01_FULL_39_24]
MNYRIKLVDLIRPHRKLKKRFLASIGKIINASDFIMGAEVEKFEKSFAKFCGKKYAISLNSGTDALRLALLAYNIGPGDEVITAPNSYFSTAMIITECGAKQIFVDINPDTYTIDTAKIKRAITSRTKAIIPVHIYGQPADMTPILQIAKKYNLKIIEDACQAHGAIYKGKAVPYGETGAFSFYPGKNLGCFGDGGILVTDNPTVANNVLLLRNDGSSKRYIHEKLGIKSRLDTIQAAVLNIKLPYLKQGNKKRRIHAMAYTKLLKDIPGITTPKEANDVIHAYHLYVIEAEKRNELQSYLSKHGIETGIHYPIPIHLQEAYKNEKYKRGDFPVAEGKARKILSLPMFPELTKKEIRYVCEMISNFMLQKRKT